MMVDNALRYVEICLWPDVVRVLPKLISVNVDLRPEIWCRGRVGEFYGKWDIIVLGQIEIELSPITSISLWVKQIREGQRTYLKKPTPAALMPSEGALFSHFPVSKPG